MTLAHPLLASLFALSLLAGCGGSGGSTSNGGSGGSTATGGSTASGGSTSTGGSTTSGGGNGGATGGSGGAGPCSGYISAVIDDGAPQMLASTCIGHASDITDTAQGYVFAGGAVGSPHGIRILGCTSAEAGAVGLTMDALDASGPGTFNAGSTQFVDQNGDTWGVENDPFEMTLTKVEPTGGAIEGTFSVIATHGGNAAHTVSGTFQVCHVADLLAP